MSDNLTRVLIVLGGRLNYGGTENFLMNYYRHIDRSKVQLDFVSQGNNEGVYDAEIQAMGGVMYYVPYKQKHPVRYSKVLGDIISHGNYQVVHAQMDAMNVWPLYIAKRLGVKHRISHSHNTGMQTKNSVKVLVNSCTMKLIPLVATELWACSEAAGVWLYGKKNMNRVRIIKNAIDTKMFSFDSESRNKIRTQYDIKNEFVIGHVGRLAYQKNHVFLLKIFCEIYKLDKNSKLLLVGDGELKQELVALSRELNIQDNVIFAGNKRNVNEYYNAMDVFVFPSYFEGLSVTFLEAQCNGLKCVCSDTLSKESDVAGVDMLSLHLSPKKWAEFIYKYKGAMRCNGAAIIKECGFDIETEAMILQELYRR